MPAKRNTAPQCHWSTLMMYVRRSAPKCFHPTCLMIRHPITVTLQKAQLIPRFSTIPHWSPCSMLILLGPVFARPTRFVSICAQATNRDSESDLAFRSIVACPIKTHHLHYFRVFVNSPAVGISINTVASRVWILQLSRAAREAQGMKL